MQYTVILYDCKNDNFQMNKCDIFLFFVQNKDGTLNLCFRAKIRNKYIPL